MIFKSPEELVEFFNNLDLDKSTLVFKTEEEEVVEEKKGCACGGVSPCQCEVPVVEASEESVVEIDLSSAESVILESLTDAPTIKLRISESEVNTFYVKAFEGIADTCGTGKIELPDRITYMNMCEQDGVATVTLNLTVEGQQLRDVKVVLATTEDDPYLVLSKEHFKS